MSDIIAKAMAKLNSIKIDILTQKSHEHTNKTLLDRFGINANNNVTVDGVERVGTSGATINDSATTSTTQTWSTNKLNADLARRKEAFINVKDFGAKGDGITDDTTSIQAAFDSLPNGGRILIPNGTYMINAVTGLRPKSKQTVSLSRYTTLKVIPNSTDSYRIFNITYVQDVTIEGGYLEGDKDNHLGTTGESGHGIVIGSQAANTVIRDIQISKMWGDGIYNGGAYASTNTKIYNVICDSNRRQGLSITFADGIVVRDSSFNNTGGALPEAGIDIEPNTGNIVRNVVIDNVKCNGNRSGLEVFGAAARPKQVTVINSEFTNNRDYGISTSHCFELSFRDCKSIGNKINLLMARENNDVTYSKCTFEGSKQQGVNMAVNLQRITSGIGTKDVTFEYCIFKNNGIEQAGTYDGCIIDNTDNKGVIERIAFNHCKFIDDQTAKTQRYGLTVVDNATISNVVLGVNNRFEGNLQNGINATGKNVYSITPILINPS